MDMAKWQYLLFDADNTLYDFSATEKAALTRLFCHYKIPESLLPVYHDGNLDCWTMYERGQLTLEALESERFRLFFQRADINENPVEAGNLYSTYPGEEGIMLPGAVEFLESLSSFDLSLITNGIARVQKERIKRTNTARFFSHIFISQEIGWAKPDPRFFDYVLSTLHTEKEKCVVIGDSLTSDIKGANNAGIASIFFSPSGKKAETATYSATSYGEIIEILRS